MTPEQRNGPRTAHLFLATAAAVLATAAFACVASDTGAPVTTPPSGSGGSTPAGGSGGSSGSGSGGATPQASGGASGSGSGGATAPVDASVADSGSFEGGDPSGGLPPLTPCTAPSVSRLKVWEMDLNGGTAVPNGSPLRKVGDAYEFHVAWTLNGGGYGTGNTPLNNKGQYTGGADPAKSAADVSGASGIFLEYSATGNTYMQLRTGAVPHGGDHFRATLPVTGTELKTIMLNFADFRRPGAGNAPPGPEILKDVFSLTFVAAGTTTLTLRQVRIPGFVPPCD